MTLTSLISEEQPPHGSAADHTEWKQAREEGTKRGEQGAPAMIDVDDSSQSDVSSCQSSHGANTHTRAHTHVSRVGHCNTHVFLSSRKSPESLITWAAFQRTSDCTFCSAPQA